MLRYIFPSMLCLMTALAIGFAQEDVLTESPQAEDEAVESGFSLEDESADDSDKAVLETILIPDEAEETERAEDAEDSTRSVPATLDDSDSFPVQAIGLQHIQATVAAKLIQRMFPDEKLIVEAEPRTNQILVRCNPVMRSKVSELIENIDRPGKEQPGAEVNLSFSKEDERVLLRDEPPGRSLLPMRRGGRVVWQAGPQRPEQDVLIRVDEAQQKIVALTDQIRALRQATEPDEKALAELERQLTERVKAAFDARQALHRAELEVLRQQLESIEQTIAARDRVKDQLVEQRVKDLVSGKVQVKWQGSGPPEDVLIAVPAGLPGEPIVAPLAPSPVAAPTPPTPPAPPEGPNTFTTWRYDATVAPEAASPLPTVIRLQRLRAQQAEIKGQMEPLEAQLTGGLGAPEWRRKRTSELRSMKRLLESLEKEVQLLSLELQAKRRAADLQLRSAQLQFNAAEEQMKRAQMLFEQGAGSSELVIQHKLQAEQARLQVQQVQDLLELFKAIDEGALISTTP
jgi:hypothetical protein